MKMGRLFNFIDELEEFEESLIVGLKKDIIIRKIDEPIANIYVSSTGGENGMGCYSISFLVLHLLIIDLLLMESLVQMLS